MTSQIKILLAFILTEIPSICLSQLLLSDSILQLTKYSVQIGSPVKLDTFYVNGGELGDLPMKAKFVKASIDLITNKTHLEFTLETSDGEILKEGIAIIGTIDSLNYPDGSPYMLRINRRVIASPDSSGTLKLDCFVNANDELLVHSFTYFARLYHINRFISKK